MIRKWDTLSAPIRRKCLNDIIARMAEEDDTEIGTIAAQEIMDIVAEHLGPQIHNRAIDDTKRLLQTKMADLEIDLDVSKAVETQ